MSKITTPPTTAQRISRWCRSRGFEVTPPQAGCGVRIAILVTVLVALLVSSGVLAATRGGLFEPLAVVLISSSLISGIAVLAVVSDTNDAQEVPNVRQKGVGAMTEDRDPQLGEIWRHFRTGTEYEILIADASIERTLQRAVCYRAVASHGQSSRVWVRPLAEWRELVQTSAGLVPRFVKVADAQPAQGEQQ